MASSSHNNQCKSISDSTGKRCKKRKLKWSRYCWIHQPKATFATTFLLSAIIGFLFNKIGNEIFPPKPEKRRDDVIERITNEAATVIKYTDAFLMAYTATVDEKSIWCNLNTFYITDASEFFNTAIDGSLERIFMNDTMIKRAPAYNSEKKQLAWISYYKWNLIQTYSSSSKFLDRFGNVDHKIVTAVNKLNKRAEFIIQWLDFLNENPEILVDWYSNNKANSLADFLSGFYLVQYEIKSIIYDENKDIYGNECDRIQN